MTHRKTHRRPCAAEATASAHGQEPYAGNYLASVLATSQDGIGVLDSQGRVEFTNKASLKILGRPMKDILGRHATELVPADQRAGANRRWRAARRGLVEPFEIDIVRKDGARRTLLIRYTPMRVGGRRKYCLVERDITEQKRYAETLRHERDRAQSYLDVANVIFVAISADQTVAMINRRGCDLFGRAEDRIVGKNWFNTFLPRRDRQAVKATFDDLMSGRIGKTEYFENRIVAAGGQDRLIAWHNTLLKDDAGRIVGTLSCGQDITQRRQAEEARRASESRYRLLVETMNDGLAAMDEKGRITFANDRFCRMLGYKTHELLGQPAAFLMDKARRGMPREMLAKRRQGICDPYEVTYVGKGGRKVLAMASPSPILDSAGRFRGSFAVVTDITSLKQAEANLRAAHNELEKRVRERTADLARANRELRRQIAERRRAEDALHAVHLKLSNVREAERKRLSHQLHDSIGQRLVAVRLQLMDLAETSPAFKDASVAQPMNRLFSHLDEMSQELRRISHSLYPPALEVLGICAGLKRLTSDWESPTVRILAHCDQTAQGVRFGDPVEIALFNIAQEALANAMRHGKCTRIDLLLAYDAGRLTLSVTDNGIGFDPEQAVGKGLGLPIMRERAEAIGASFSLTSKPGCTCVEVSLTAKEETIK